MPKQFDAKYVLGATVIILAILVYLILKPFVITILSSLVLAYIFHPVYKFLKKLFKNSNFASFITCFILILLFIIPIVFIANSVTREATVTYVMIKQFLATGELFGESCNSENFICSLSGSVSEYLKDPQLNYQITNITQKVTDFFIDQASKFIFTIPIFLVNFFIMIFIIFFLLKEGEHIVQRIRKILPLKKIHKKSIFDQLKDVTYAVIYGHILVSALQAIIGGVAFFFLGVTSPILWGIIMFFTALIPFVGAAAVWVPVVIIKAITAHPYQATILLAIGLFISTFDNFLKPKIISDRARIHPVVVLIGVIGGLSLLGPVGIIVGPVLLSVAIAFLEIYEEEQIEIKG